MELVVLVDKQNNQIGTAPKDKVHTDHTPLHRGFSLFVFNTKGDVLITKRAANKKTFPGVWTNTVCGHPAPGERVEDAAKRRAKNELGLSVDVKVIAPYQYSFADKNGIMENEICPILVGHTEKDPTPDPQEVADWKWMPWQEFLSEIKLHQEIYSPWSIEETAILQSLITTP